MVPHGFPMVPMGSHQILWSVPPGTTRGLIQKKSFPWFIASVKSFFWFSFLMDFLRFCLECRVRLQWFIPQVPGNRRVDDCIVNSITQAPIIICVPKRVHDHFEIRTTTPLPSADQRYQAQIERLQRWRTSRPPYWRRNLSEVARYPRVGICESIEAR